MSSSAIDPELVRPSIANRFPVSTARDVLRAVLREKVARADKVTAEVTRDLAETVKSRLKDLAGAGARYKIIAHVVFVEATAVGKLGADGAPAPPRGAGVHVSTRCLWDAAVDDLVSESYTNDAVTAVATAYAVYAY